jgi:subtilase family serine protease
MGKPFAWKATIDDHFYHNERMDEWYTSGTTLPGWFDWKSAVPGTHNITVQLDTTNVFDEDNETNNIATRKITILKKVVNSNPDLRISEAEIALPSEAMTDGDKVTFGAIVHAANLTHTINVTVEMLVDNILIEKLVTPMSQDAFSVWFNWTAVKGQHNVTFRVIPEQGITETDKTNNIATKAFSVQAPPKKPHHDNMTATYAIIGVVIAAVIAGIVGWFIVSKRKKKEKDPQ